MCGAHGCILVKWLCVKMRDFSCSRLTRKNSDTRSLLRTGRVRPSFIVWETEKSSGESNCLACFAGSCRLFCMLSVRRTRRSLQSVCKAFRKLICNGMRRIVNRRRQRSARHKMLQLGRRRRSWPCVCWSYVLHPDRRESVP